LKNLRIFPCSKRQKGAPPWHTPHELKARFMPVYAEP
jgi:hypothetical protein